MPGRTLITDPVAEAMGFGGIEARRRREVLRETLRAFEQAVPRDRFHRLAEANLQRWRDAVSGPAAPCQTQVIAGDWGDVTGALTRSHGRCFAVLNMANAYVPGGAYVEGAAAQEENLFRRTDCHFHVTDAEYDAGRDRYTPDMTRLISARDGVVYLDVGNPRVCIRGPEDRTRKDLGYSFLDEADIFPFLELRCAAQDLRDGRAFDEEDARRRIAAQLDTLAGNGVRHAILGASGCGAFQNPSRRVAELYREEIDKRSSCFDVLAFAIHHAGYGPDNFEPFSEVFS